MITALLAWIDLQLTPIRKAWRRWYLEMLFYGFYCTSPLERQEFIEREDAADFAAATLHRDRNGPVTMREAWEHGSALYRGLKDVPPPPPRKGSSKWAGL